MYYNDVKSAVDKFSHGKYEVVDFLGSGAFADLYIVKHKFIDDLRVMKVIRENLTSDSKINTILQEVRVISPLNHENIITIYDAGIFTINNQDHVYFIMEYVPAGDLNKFLNAFINSKMMVPTFWTLFLIKQISLGLSILHSANPPIIHSDLNPKNILLSFNSKVSVVVKLTDFGFVKQLDNINNKYSIAGTKPFMAPECFKEEYYISTDIYSLGVIFYVFLTNHYPYNLKGYDFSEILDGKPWKKELKPPSYYNSNVLPVIDEIVLKCLAYDYTQRYFDAEELYRDIRSAFRLYDLDEDTVEMTNSVKKAFRLAKYENKESEAIELLDKYYLTFLLDDEVVETADKTIHLDKISDILKKEK